jgi:hypothetical protein
MWDKEHAIDLIMLFESISCIGNVYCTKKLWSGNQEKSVCETVFTIT